ADVGFGFVVLHVQLDGPAVDPARLVDAVHGHLDADECGLAPRRTGTRKRLQRADLVGLGLAEGGPPRPRYQRRGSERYGAARSPPPEQPAARELAAAPEFRTPISSFLVVDHRGAPLVIGLDKEERRRPRSRAPPSPDGGQ